jgi:hypothetical protein
MNIGHLVEYATLLLLVLYWILTDIRLRTKIIWTVVYAASWALLFISAGLHWVSQAILAAVFLYATFGPERI